MFSAAALLSTDVFTANMVVEKNTGTNEKDEMYKL
jgi:hypothetical protein